MSEKYKKMAGYLNLDSTEQHSIKDFTESKEENTAQKNLEVIITDPELARFINLEIHNSNAEDGTCFNDAFITLKSTHDLRRKRAGFITGRPKCQVVEMKNILDTNILDVFLAGGVNAIEKYAEPVCQSFLVLLNFLKDMKNHESAIGKILDAIPKNATKETRITAGLAHHLFSQLVPNKMYEVDKYAKQLPKTCACGCNEDICRGDTSLGSRRTWHGQVDVMVNHTIAVVIQNIKTNVDDDDSGDDEEDTDANEPARKQRKLETDKSCDMCVEIKGNRRYESVLLDVKVLNQILAEAITNGFAQVNKNNNTLSHFLIPTFGVTSDHVTVCLYDPENDCLLHIDDELELWLDKGTRRNLDPETIVIIWLFLNFTVLTKKNLATTKLHKSGFQESLKENLMYYRETKAKEKIAPQTIEARPWKKITKEFVHP
ncbi:uncharacterized protein LOC117329815 [Pecten maximus]|uniref:uncharacterized protein LOC117329815 n=1 Tax=Pecten maximus TaxID=6579 RepID=UPI00145915A8|nr:uncharacterized protein LOC117329815 [Pecten maximus]